VAAKREDGSVAMRGLETAVVIGEKGIQATPENPLPPFENKDIAPRFVDFDFENSRRLFSAFWAGFLNMSGAAVDPAKLRLGPGERWLPENFAKAQEEGEKTKTGTATSLSDVFLMFATAYRLWWVREEVQKQLGVKLPDAELPLELHSVSHLARAYPKASCTQPRCTCEVCEGEHLPEEEWVEKEWAYILLVNYPKLGPVCGLGYRRPPAPEDFEGKKLAPGAEWESLLALAGRGCAIQATSADTLRILRRLLKGKALRELIREPSPTRYRYPGNLKDVQRTLTHGPKGGHELVYSQSGERVARFTYKDKVNTQLVLDETRTSLEDVNAYIARTVRELGPLTLKVWHAALCFAAEDMMHGLDGGSFWWSPDRMLALEGMAFHTDSRRGRQEKLRLLHEDLWHEVHTGGGGGEAVTIRGHLIDAISPDTTCTLEVPGRRVQWYRVILHPTIGNEVREAKAKGRFALLDKKWFRLDPREHPIALCLYPFLEDQWIRNWRDVAGGKRQRWLGLSVQTLTDAAGLDIDPINPSRTRTRIDANLAKMKELGLIGGWTYTEGGTVPEDILDAWPPEDHEGINRLLEKYQTALPPASSDAVC
jgi:hypothetical protein